MGGKEAEGEGEGYARSEAQGRAILVGREYKKDG